MFQTPTLWDLATQSQKMGMPALPGQLPALETDSPTVLQLRKLRSLPGAPGGICFLAFSIWLHAGARIPPSAQWATQHHPGYLFAASSHSEGSHGFTVQRGRSGPRPLSEPARWCPYAHMHSVQVSAHGHRWQLLLCGRPPTFQKAEATSASEAVTRRHRRSS